MRPAQPPAARGRRASAPWTQLLRGSGLLGHGVRYVLTGGATTIVYLAGTTVLAEVAGLTFQIALAAGASAGLAVHFSLQRFFVWSHRDRYALALPHQAARYLVFAGVQYGLTAASTALLPAVLRLPVEVVYVASVAVLVSMNFLVFRNLVFHAKASVQA